DNLVVPVWSPFFGVRCSYPFTARSRKRGWRIPAVLDPFIRGWFRGTDRKVVAANCLPPSEPFLPVLRNLHVNAGRMAKAIPNEIIDETVKQVGLVSDRFAPIPAHLACVQPS